VSEESASRALPSAERRALLAIGAAVGALAAATLALWAYYGTALFYEMILAGMNACF
jgi:hypothetical protein